jgi:CDGSH-type Zn-finger protein
MVVYGKVPFVRLVRVTDASKGVGGWSETAIPTTEPYAVCRCGRSSTMPLCDRQPPYGCFVEENADGPEPGPFRWDVPDPSLPAVALKPNGPARVAGGIALVHAGGRQPARDRVSLCRCGNSRSQPVCDGSHKMVGFKEP